MNAVGIVMFTALLAVVTYLSLRLSAQNKLLRKLQSEHRMLAEVWRAEQPELSRFIGPKPGPFITIEILNAVELASQTSRVGGLIGKYAPNALHRMVVKRTADNMRHQMMEHGVEVEVVVHGLD